jgi:hypothetical protein
MWDLWWTKWRWGRFSLSTSVSCASSQFLIPPTASRSPSTIIRGWYNRPNSGWRAKWTQSHCTPRNLKKTYNKILIAFRFSYSSLHVSPITVAAQSKAWTVFARSNTGIVGSNPTQGMDVCMRLFCVCVLLCVGSGIATGWSPVQGVLPTVCRFKKLKKRQRPNKGL